MIKGQHYKINVITGPDGLDPVADNVDVEVSFDDGSRYTATFFTLQNIEKLMNDYERTGECMNGFYIWASDMIIVRRISSDGIAKVVADLIKRDEFEKSFSRCELSAP